MTDFPDLWWSPGREVLFEKRLQYVAGRLFRCVPVYGRGFSGEVAEEWLPQDAIRVCLDGEVAEEPHIIALTENGWTLRHPGTCQSPLLQCPVNKAAVRSEPLGDRLGRFVCTVDDEGFLVIGEPTP